jgi:hypothetical protein
MLPAVSLVVPISNAQSTQSSSPSWAFSGAYLNYTANGNLAGTFKLSNGSSLSLSFSVNGSLKILVNSISDGNANVTSTPNLVLKQTETFFNGTTSSQTTSETSANASTSDIPLEQLNFGSLLQQEMSNVSSSYFFSPSLNASLSSSPATFYQWNSTTKIPAIELNSSVTQVTALPSSAGLSGSYSINGTSLAYLTISENIPLKVTSALRGSANIQGAAGLTQQLAYSDLQESTGSASGNFDLTITLVATNVNLEIGTVEQSVISVPTYSTSLAVISNSTLNSASTSGNQLIVNVTGPSGTTGVLDVIVSQSLLNQSQITNPSQVTVSLDGQSYTNYTVSEIDGSFVFTIYYHHSSHNIVLGFGNANLGSTKGSISSLSSGGSSSSSNPLMLSGTLLYGIIAVIVVVVLVAVFAVMRRGKGAASSPTSAPSPSS